MLGAKEVSLRREADFSALATASSRFGARSAIALP
jgi:hypothetical protein